MYRLQFQETEYACRQNLICVTHCLFSLLLGLLNRINTSTNYSRCRLGYHCYATGHHCCGHRSQTPCLHDMQVSRNPVAHTVPDAPASTSAVHAAFPQPALQFLTPSCTQRSSSGIPLAKRNLCRSSRPMVTPKHPGPM